MRDTLVLALVRAESCRAFGAARRRPAIASKAGNDGVIGRTLRSIRRLRHRHAVDAGTRQRRAAAGDAAAPPD